MKTPLNLLGRLATDSGCVTERVWVEGALRRLSVALCKSNGFRSGKICTPSAGLLVLILQRVRLVAVCL